MIKLNKDYFIDFDQTNITLYKSGIKGEKSKNKGEATSKVIGYFGNFESLVSSLVNKIALDSEVNSIQELVEYIEQVKNDILNSIIELKPDTSPYGNKNSE